MAPNKLYDQIPRERYEILRSRYDQFILTLTDTDKDAIKIFDRLGPKQLEDLQLIREVSVELQKKKEEDMRKAAQAAEEATKAEAEAKSKEELETKEESEAKEESEESKEVTEEKGDEKSTKKVEK